MRQRHEYDGDDVLLSPALPSNHPHTEKGRNDAALLHFHRKSIYARDKNVRAMELRMETPLRAVGRLRGCDNTRAILLEVLGNLVGGFASAQVAANHEPYTASHIRVFLDTELVKRGDERVVFGV